MYYVPLKVKTSSVHGFKEVTEAMRLPKRSKSDSYSVAGTFVLGEGDKRLATGLIRGGDDHAKAIRGIVVWLKVEMQTGWMIEFETYRHGVECLSTSSAMHGELKQLKGSALAEQKQADLPDKVYTRSLTASYQTLRNMYFARWNHRHGDWRIFCQWIEDLPYADTLIFPEGSKNVQLLD